MTPEELKSARERYGYIPARSFRVRDDGIGKLTWKSLKLDIDVPLNWASGDPRIRKRYSSVELDMFHRELLNSDHDVELMHGVLSVVFWGLLRGLMACTLDVRVSQKAAILHGRGSTSPEKAEQIIEHLKKAREFLKGSPYRRRTPRS